jgi:dTDP-4-amino-4,6-dideoxygalactose transaminase
VRGETEEREILAVLRAGKWNRNAIVARFEREYAALAGAAHCLATASGTSALLASLGALGLKAGDEVIVPPYTFIATINAVTNFGATPVFVDSDIHTFQIDAARIEAALTPRTRAIVPVHLGGAAADLDKILDVARRHRLPVIEDACQAHLGQWRNRQVGTFGLAGCFSFQASKNLNCGEGGAVLTGDTEFAERLYTFHNNGTSRHTGTPNFTYAGRGLNLRLSEFQAAILLAQMTRLEEQARKRETNAAYLSDLLAATDLLAAIPGLTPQRLTAHCTRNAWHLFMFRYQGRLPKERFLEAMRAEGIPCSGGYRPFSPETCPVNVKLCSEAVWLTQTMLLDSRSGMEQIAEAARKVEQNANRLA